MLYKRAAKNLTELGADIQWAPNAAQTLKRRAKDSLFSTPLEERLADFEWAITNSDEVILTALGGFNSYQLLDRIPFAMMASKGKILVGHSDATLILNAYFALTGMPSWYGPNFRNLGDQYTGDISSKNMVNAITNDETEWAKSRLYRNSFTASPRSVKNWIVLQEGISEGVGIGGNLGSFFLLQGTKYMPLFDQPTILFVEEDEMPGKFTVQEFDRRLRSLLDQPGVAQNIQGLIIGRFLDECKVRLPDLKKVIAEIPVLNDIPILANVEIGHGMPRLMLPIGGRILLDTKNNMLKVSPDRNRKWRS